MSLDTAVNQMFSYSKYSFVIPTYCWDWNRNLQMISLRSIFQPDTLSTAPCLLARLTELKQSTPVVQINGSVWDSLWTPEFEMKHLKKDQGHTGRNVCEYYNNDEFNSPIILSNNDYQVLSPKFSQVVAVIFTSSIQ